MIHPDELINTAAPIATTNPMRLTLVKRSSSALDGIKIAAPCHQSWEGMKGDSRVRFCDSCHLNVYNLSGMSRQEAQELVENAEGRLCVRFYQRPDGTVLTRDCPVGVRAIRMRLALSAACALGMFISIWSFITRRPQTLPVPIQQILRVAPPPVVHMGMPRPMMGAVAFSPSPRPVAQPMMTIGRIAAHSTSPDRESK